MSITATKNCINPSSYGEICVQCNACGRFGGNQEDIFYERSYKNVSKN